MIFHRTLHVPQLHDYRAYRDLYLRPDYLYRCAYCLLHEQLFQGEDGGQIDHHRPLRPPARTGKDFSGLKNVYRNLYWTCGRCNSAKGNKWPTDEEFEAGLRFLDPCLEDHRDHWDVRDDGRLVPKTNTGEYTITNLFLNRRFLVTMRRRFHEKQRRVGRVIENLSVSNISPADRAEIADLLRDDFLLSLPAFIP